MDTTTIGIAFGIVLAGGYAVLRACARQSFELSHTVLIFLAAFSVPGGLALIAAGYIGDAKNLPSSWREHVTVAGIVAIGLALHYVGETFKDCLVSLRQSKKPTNDTEENQLPG